jgi:pre-mRNA-processing factor 17
MFAQRHRAVPYTAVFAPEDGNTLLVGTADRKILQWDLRTKEKVAFYKGHTDAINTITFLEAHQARHFVTSSDDKSLRTWTLGDYSKCDIFADSNVQRLVSSARHPSENYIAYQSLSNIIHVFSPEAAAASKSSADDDAATQKSSAAGVTLRHKRFIGHTTGGYPCQIGFSPDGQFIFSGDSRGCVTLWDWQSGAIVRRLDAHKQVCVGVEWNPATIDSLVTASWDGTMKLWTV